MKISLGLTSTLVLSLAYVVDDLSYTYALDLSSNPTSNEYILAWLLANSKPLFGGLPFVKPSVEISNSVYSQYPDPISRFVNQINNTNILLREIYHLRNTSASHSQSSVASLVFTVENLRYKSLFSFLSASSNHELIFVDEPSNYDGINRKFLDKPPLHSIRDIITLIVDSGARNVVSVNLAPLLKYMFTENINVFAVLSFLGVTLFRIQNDPSELCSEGYLIRQLSDYGSREFILHSMLSESYDSGPEVCACPAPIMQNYSEYNSVPYTFVGPSPEVVVISNSRFTDVMNNVDSFLPILESMDNPFVELPLWYLSVSRLLDQDTVFTRPQIDQKRSSAHWIFYHAAQYLKFDIVQRICSDCDLSVYGDNGWNNVCPDNYKGFLEVDRLSDFYCSSSKILLMLNFGYTYLDHSGPVYDVIRDGTNWLNVPALVVTSELEGLRSLEYSNCDQLAEKLNSFSSYALESHSSRARLASIYHSATENFEQSLRDPISRSAPCLFLDSYNEHKNLLSKLLNNYLASNSSRLLSSLYS